MMDPIHMSGKLGVGGDLFFSQRIAGFFAAARWGTRRARGGGFFGGVFFSCHPNPFFVYSTHPQAKSYRSTP